MKRFTLTATLLSPLVIRRDRQSERSEGLEFVSGTLLRGALAQAYLQQHGDADEAFARLFLDEDQCRFGTLAPNPNQLPLCAVSCKRATGFRADGGHGVADQLWFRLARRLAGREPSAELSVSARRCQECGNDLKTFTGFWRGRGDVHRQHEGPARVRKTATVHVGIDRLTHTASESIFYTLEALDPGRGDVKLVGELAATEQVVADLRALLDSVGGTVRLGHARTRGHGRVKLEMGQSVDLVRLDREGWSRDLLRFLAEHPGLNAAPLDSGSTFFFSVGLPEGALLVDRLLRGSLDLHSMCDWLPPLPPPEEHVATLERPGTPAPDGGKLWCVTAFTHPERVRGWNAAHGLPRQDEWSVGRGAVYAYLFQGGREQQLALLARLDRLERDGAGARRNEGFGRVIVSDDFHRLCRLGLTGGRT